MTTLDIQYIETGNGKRLVVIDEETFEAYREAAEELEDIELYDQAKADDDGERTLFSDYLAKRAGKKEHV